MTDVRSYPSADCETDHLLLAGKMRAKPVCNKHKRKQGKLDVKMLNDPTTKAKFESETEKRFEAEALLQDPSNISPESLWMTYKTILSETAEETLGRVKRSPKKPWIPKETMDQQSVDTS